MPDNPLQSPDHDRVGVVLPPRGKTTDGSRAELADGLRRMQAACDQVDEEDRRQRAAPRYVFPIVIVALVGLGATLLLWPDLARWVSAWFL